MSNKNFAYYANKILELKKNKIENTSLIYWILIFILFLSIMAFIFKFKSLSFLFSQPADWSIFISYLNGIIIPVLSFLNLIVFIKLTKSIQRASENKSWVERTEKLIFDLIDSISKEAIFLTIFSMELKNLQSENKKAYIADTRHKIVLLNYDAMEKEYKLRIYIGSEIFDNCKTRESFLSSTKILFAKMNTFSSAYSLPKSDISAELQKAYREIEESLKFTVNEGKRFCDEIYHIEEKRFL